MKYSFTINQKAIVDSGLELDLQDACIMSFLNSFALSPSNEKKFIDQKVYCWFQYANIIANLPLLKMKKDAVYRRLKNLCDLKLLEAHPDNQSCGKAFFHLTNCFFDMFFDVDLSTVLKPYPPVSKTEPPTVLKPDYYSINDNNNELKRGEINSPIELFPNSEGNRNAKKAKPKTKKAVRENSEIFQACKTHWLEVIHPKWAFTSSTGENLYGLISKLKKRLTDERNDSSDTDVSELFKVVCGALPEWYKTKDIPILNSKFNELLEEIKNEVNGTIKKSTNHRDIGQQYRSVRR